MPPQLPTLYLSVLRLAHLLTTPCSPPAVSSPAQNIFGVCVFIIVGTFWRFKGLALGIEGPINDHWGLKRRSDWIIYND